MTRPRRANTTRFLRAALVLLLVLILAFAAVMMVIQYRASRAAAEIQAHRTAHVVATQFGWMFQASAQALRRIEEAVNASAPDLETQSDINDAVQDLPRGFQYSVYEPSGRLWLSSLRHQVEIDVHDRGYFQSLKAGKKLVIFPMTTERLSGEKVFIIARRLDTGGVFSGVASIAIPAKSLAELSYTLDFPNGSAISLVNADGDVIARNPPVEATNIAGTRSFAEMSKSENGTFYSLSPVDGERRVVGYWKLPDWPVIAVAGIDERAVYAEFRKGIRADLVILLPLVAGLLMLIVWLFRLMGVDERRAAALEAANERSDFLIKEIHHRVKNNLQAVMSLVRLQRLPEEVSSALLGRISAMVEVHRDIFAVETQDRIMSAPYLNRVIANISRGYSDKIVVKMAIADVSLSGDLAMQLGLLTNELMSNAYKHAFKGREGGVIEVSLSEIGDDRLQLVIQDDGPGYDPEAERSNMGSKLIAAFVGQMGGRMVVTQDNGYRSAIDFPARLQTLDL